MKYLIDKRDNEVKFKEITLNIDDYGDSLIELSAEELDEQLKEYSKQGLYVSVYYQIKTMRHGIEFGRKRFTSEQWGNPEYNFRPKDMPDDEPHSDECAYSIKPSLIDVEIYEETYQTAMMDNEIHNNPYLPKKHYYFLTPKELAEVVKGYLDRGMQVNFG